MKYFEKNKGSINTTNIISSSSPYQFGYNLTSVLRLRVSPLSANTKVSKGNGSTPAPKDNSKNFSIVICVIWSRTILIKQLSQFHLLEDSRYCLKISQ